jgi:ribosomal protein L10
VPNAAKVRAVESMRQRLKGVHTAVLTEYRGLTVRQISDLRKQLKGAAAEYRVLQNRLARLAVRGSALDPLAGHFTGPLGLVFTRQDPVVVAKTLQAFVKTNPTLTIKLGMVDGTILQPEELRALADLPSREALRGQLVGAIQGPMAQLVSLLRAPLQQLVRVLEARAEGTTESAG